MLLLFNQSAGSNENANIALQGIDSFSFIGLVNCSGAATLIQNGLESVGQVGIVSASGSMVVNAFPLGIFADSNVGFPSSTGYANHLAIGIDSIGYVGVATADGGGISANAPLSGVSATGFNGFLSLSGSAITNLTGVFGNGRVWEQVTQPVEIPQDPPTSTGGATGRVTTFSKPYKPARATLRAKSKSKTKQDEEDESLFTQDVHSPIVKKITRLPPEVRESIRLQVIAEMQDEEDMEDLLSIIAVIFS